MPVNITTVNTICNEHIQNTNDMHSWLKNNQCNYDNIENSEHMAKSRIGATLYEKLIKPYTFKQWNK